MNCWELTWMHLTVRFNCPILTSWGRILRFSKSRSHTLKVLLQNNITFKLIWYYMTYICKLYEKSPIVGQFDSVNKLSLLSTGDKHLVTQVSIGHCKGGSSTRGSRWASTNRLACFYIPYHNAAYKNKIFYEALWRGPVKETTTLFCLVNYVLHHSVTLLRYCRTETLL